MKARKVCYQWLFSSVCAGLSLNYVLLDQAAAQGMSAADLSRAATEALGRDAQGIAFTAEGWDACLGQAWSVNEGWARWELTDYQRVIDYANGKSQQNSQRRAGMDPDRVGGCGAQPGASPRPQQSFIDSATPWPDQLPLWMTPHGFLHLLAGGEPEIVRATEGWRVTLPLERDGITYTLIGTFNEGFELESLQSWVDNTVFGDMEVRTDFGPYQDYGQLRFPQTLDMQQGGYTTLYLDIGEVSPHEDPVENRTSPRSLPPPAATEEPAYTEIGEGVFVFHGPYQSVAVAFEDFSVVIDGLQSDSRVSELIPLVKQAIPNKPIRYVVSTHSHFDHASGLRQFAAEGAVILTHAMNVNFFQRALSTPRTLNQTPTEPAQVPVHIQGIEGRFVISDGVGQQLELHSLAPGAHAADSLVAYLPALKTVVEADLLQPWINPIFGGSGEGPHPFLVYLDDELESSGLDYEQFVPIHVPPEPPLMDRAALKAVVAD